MQDIILIVRWPGATESLYLGQTRSLRQGAELDTFERWPGYDKPTKYHARLQRIKQTGEVVYLRIEYRAEDNATGQALDNDCWGVSEISINLQSGSGSARWHDDRPGQDIESRRKVQIIFEDDLVNLGMLQTKRRLRKQKAFRKHLLGLDEACVLSGETTHAALEAAHIVDVKGDGGFSPSNGILLRADLHRLFDEGLLKINDAGEVSFSREAALSQQYMAGAALWRISDSALKRVKRRLRERNALKADA